METYKQDIKEKSRIEIWENAISRLTSNHESSRILETSYLEKLIDFCWKDILPDVFDYEEKIVLRNGYSWVKKIESSYKKKKPSDLRIAFFCGPEPENDLNILLSLGVEIENIWAFEVENRTYNEALSKARKHFQKLKIFPGSIGEFFNTTHQTFDIIYLDFVSSLLTKSNPPLGTIHSVFDNQALSDLGVLIVNSCEPDNNDGNAEFLSHYFYNHSMIESSVLNSNDGSNDNQFSSFTESPICHGHDPASLKQEIEKNISGAYSAFSTNYICYYASMLSPTIRFLKNNSLKRQLFSNNPDDIKNTFSELSSVDAIKNLLTGDSDPSIEYSPIAGDRFMDANSFPFWNFIESLNNESPSSYFKDLYRREKEGVSILKAAQFRESIHSMLTGGDKLLSKRILSALPQIMSTIPDARGGLFCDIPMPHLWLEVALNQLGAPYHINVKKHKRWKYKSKVRTMHTDLFVFDRCRAFYDSLPMIDQYESILTNIEEQIYSRCCIDIIGKQSRWPISNLYFGSNLICINDSDWSDFADFERRIEIKGDEA
ncbi:hypothetical protein IG611_14245 [Pectobacterium sp. A535-S3-A17]|uniref:hypothetical protein n=2 Tax=Pectobacterium quasiaquaticum TaxID=2774015 RepID=UPI001874DBC8|nr:hypothetical protein [Pectobacterium quasiaquaticum]MBE5214461.1 hypothetical protein [Pectobacterium quasiaquaticum]MBE5226506.1 hypothetical protein [Pectobacterium quasiaquaticum]